MSIGEATRFCLSPSCTLYTPGATFVVPKQSLECYRSGLGTVDFTAAHPPIANLFFSKLLCFCLRMNNRPNENAIPTPGILQRN